MRLLLNTLPGLVDGFPLGQPMLSLQALCINVHATTRHLATRCPTPSGFHWAPPDKGRSGGELKYNVTWPGAQCCHAGDLFLSECGWERPGSF